MRISLNELRARATNFARDWAGAPYEKGEMQSFYNDFFEIFDVKRRSVARYEEHVKRLGKAPGYMDLFWPNVLLVEQKSAGRSLAAAREQADEYFDALPDNTKPRYLLLSDFQNFALLDHDERQETHFPLADLPQHVEKFGFIMGIQKRSFKDQDPVNIKASELMGHLHDELKAAGYPVHDLEQFLVRIVFCLFADNTGIFERDLFLSLLEERTRQDGSDTGTLLTQLFQVLNTPSDKRRRTLDKDLGRFPYINGDLFRDVWNIPAFNASTRRRLINACLFDWSAISPAIFGSLFQSVMDARERREQGAHYTTEQNIMKVIQPLFLDELRAEFQRLTARRDNRRIRDLQGFQKKLSTLRFFDPACGCGNFLIIAYRELRELELDVLKARHPTGQVDGLTDILSLVNMDQFYGIELNEFPVRIAETALWMMDHIMNNRISLEFGKPSVRIPPVKSPTIRHADALETDWAGLLPPEQCDYVLGNPPFSGAKFQNAAQRRQVHRLAALGGSGGSLDYVTAWFLRAGEYARHGNTCIAFVATNSITQGEQVAQLWPVLFQRNGLEITFAHCPFAWGSDARGKAQVHVVIIGLARAPDAPAERRLFSYEDPKADPHESHHAALTPYLFDAGGLTNPHLVVSETSQPLNGMPKLIMGSKPIDGGHYILTTQEKDALLDDEPGAAPFLRPFIGAREYLNGGHRWILALHNAPPRILQTLPNVRERIAAVRQYRLTSKSKPTQALAKTPTLYHLNVIPTSPFLIVPRVSSERREYVPIGWLEPPTIPSDATLIVADATKPQFALLTSAIHMAWLRHIGGRLEVSYRYSAGIVYNNFPIPPVKKEKLESLTPHAEAVLAARAEFPDASLADLYDPDTMPPILRNAHQALDRAVDRLYRRNGFATERERVEHLFALYETMTAPLGARATPTRGR